MKLRYDAILWDLDGTLLNTLDDLWLSVNAALEANGLPARSREEVAAFTGNGIRRLMERAVPVDCPEEIHRAAFDFFCAHYKAHCEDHTRPYDGVMPLLARIREAGGRCAIVSNKAAFAVEELAARYFPDTIAAAIGATDTRRTKPAPDMVDAALERLGVPRERALYIGDSEVDVATADAAGLSGVIVTWGFRSREQLVAAGAKRFADTPEALSTYIFEEV